MAHKLANSYFWMLFRPFLFVHDCIFILFYWKISCKSLNSYCNIFADIFVQIEFSLINKFSSSSHRYRLWNWSYSHSGWRFAGSHILYVRKSKAYKLFSKFKKIAQEFRILHFFLLTECCNSFTVNRNSNNESWQSLLNHQRREDIASLLNGVVQWAFRIGTWDHFWR